MNVHASAGRIKSLVCEKQQPTCYRLWFFERFVSQQPCHGVMNPTGDKYNRRHRQLSFQDLCKFFDGKPRRYRKKNTLWSLAVVPMHIKERWADFALLDIDHGGDEAVQTALSLCRQHGVWGFAQISESHQHQGGHLWIPCSKRMPEGVLKLLAETIKATVS